MYVAHAAFCVSVWHGNGLRMRIGRTFEHRQHSEKAFLRLFVHGNVQLTWVSDTHAWTLPLVSDTHACTLPLVSDTQTCVVRSRPNISSKTCHRGLWSALRSQGRRQSSCQVAEHSAKKIQNVMLKNHFDQGKYSMLRRYHSRIYKY